MSKKRVKTRGFRNISTKARKSKLKRVRKTKERRRGQRNAKNTIKRVVFGKASKSERAKTMKKQARNRGPEARKARENAWFSQHVENNKQENDKFELGPKTAKNA